MDKPNIKVTLQGKLQNTSEESEFTTSVGANLLIKVDNAETSISLNYKDPDSLKLKLDGKIKIAEIHGIKFVGGASLVRDILKNENTYEGILEIVIDKNIAADIQYLKGPQNSYIGAGISINF